MKPASVPPPEVHRDEGCDGDGDPVYGELGCESRRGCDVIEEAADVETCRNSTDRTRQHVVEQKRGDRHFGELRPHGFLDDSIHATSHKHRGALDVDRAHAVREQHDGENEPRR